MCVLWPLLSHAELRKLYYLLLRLPVVLLCESLLNPILQEETGMKLDVQFAK